MTDGTRLFCRKTETGWLLALLLAWLFVGGTNKSESVQIFFLFGIDFQFWILDCPVRPEILRSLRANLFDATKK